MNTNLSYIASYIQPLVLYPTIPNPNKHILNLSILRGKLPYMETMSDAAREAKREYQRQWQRANRYKIRKYISKYRQSMSEEAKEAQREYHRKWQKENPDKARAYQNAYWERKAQEKLNGKAKEGNQ